ncbi:MAG: SDR family oxidoreductase [Chloroflexi bacterium]|nr:SDR family oxidoreductase [Chloroflexota bacterium]
MDFTGKVGLVTGASRGIGRAVAQHLAQRGARVAVHYHRSGAAAQETLATLAGKGHMLAQADMGDADAVQRMVAEVVRQMGGLHILVNNAGIYEEHPLDKVSYAEWQAGWRRTLATNLIGPANACYCAAQHMIGNGGGRIVNVSSRGAFRGEPDAPAYGASKGGLNSMSQSLAKALAPHNIFVGVVAPGWVETDMASEHLAGPQGDSIRAQSPLGRVASVDDVAYAVLFLASDGAEFSTGTIIDVNGASYLRM